MRLPGLSAAVLALLATSTAAHGDHSHDHHEHHEQQHELPLDQALAAANQSLLWGTYRPNLYFGLRPRLPSSLLTGLLWFGAHDFLSHRTARHACDQGDGLVYTFTEHDGRGAAVQVVKDELNNVEMTMRFLKVPAPEGGGSWAVRISGKPLKPELLSRISLLNYFGNDGPLGFLELVNDEDEEGLEGNVELKGSANGLGDFTLRIEDNPDNEKIVRGPHADDFENRLERTHFYGVPVPAGQVWRAKDLFMNAIRANSHEVLKPYGQENPPDPALLFQLPDEVRYGANLFGFQRTYQGTWSTDIFFDSAVLPFKLDSKTLDSGLTASSSSFHGRFAATFPLSSTFTPAQITFAEHITSNLLGGIGYFHGSSIVDKNFAHEWDDEDEFEGGRGKQPKPELTEERELLTATPSRSFFPRGFYWDEGFHLLVVGAWDNDLSLTILADWINLIDTDGWVAREQILGEEARSKVPQQFQTQYPTYANPPTLSMAVTAYIDRLKKAGISLDDLEAGGGGGGLDSLHIDRPQLAKEYLTSIYAKLKLHYDWFRTSQRGQIREWGRRAHSRSEGYRWRGRTADHVLTSGLDDYPRARPPHIGELHLDLISWMGFFSRTMGEIAEFLGEDEDLAEFEGNYEAIVRNVEDLHWSEEKQMYCDASVDEDDESIHICHPGYISLFPFLLGLLPPSSPHLSSILNLMRDPEHLWSPFGIRSLSKQDEHFGQGEDYWRGPIWVQMNYMALSALYKTYAKEPGPNQVRAAEIYAELRTNVINNVFSEYERTGTVWEQYDAVTGEGKRSNPFTGWTSLVTLIMAEQY